MNDIRVWLPIATAFAGFGLGGLIGYAVDVVRRHELREIAEATELSLQALADSCREVLSEAWFNKVRRRYTTKIRDRIDL